ncbi:MAG: hypothetical protein ABW123_01410, partial [Cystobacter sp.]
MSGIDKLITHPREDFEAASIAAEKADKELAKLVAGFGPALSKEEQDAAIKAFKETPSNAAIYERAEETADTLLTAINDASKNRESLPTGSLQTLFDKELDAAKELLPRLANTEKGRDAIADAVEALGSETDEANKKSELLSLVATTPQALRGADTAIVKSVTQRLLSLSKDNAGEAQKLFDGLKRAGPFLGLSNEDAAKLGDNLKDIHQNKPGALDAFKETVTRAKIDAPGGNTEGRRDFIKALGLAATIASFSSGLQDGNVDAVIKTTSEALQIGADGGSVITGVLSSSDPARFASVGKAFEKVGGIAGIVGGVADFITAGKNFAAGDYGKGVTSLLSAAGGVLSGASAIVSVPVVGQIAAGLLTVGGFIGGFIVEAVNAAKEEALAEGNARSFLEGGGVRPDAARELADLSGPEHKNVGPAIVQLAERLQFAPRDFLRFIAEQPPEKIAGFVDNALAIPQDPRHPDRLVES